MRSRNFTGAAEITLKTLHDKGHVKGQEESPGRRYVYYAKNTPFKEREDFRKRRAGGNTFLKDVWDDVYALQSRE